MPRVIRRPPNSPAPTEGGRFIPWTPEALDIEDRPTTPYAITERLPATAPARRQPPTTRLGAAVAPSLRPVADWHRFLKPALIAGGVIVLLAVLVVLAGGGALGQRLGLHPLASTGGATRLGAAPASAAAAAAPAPGGDLSAMSAADLLPTGIPVKRTDWVITKDYAAHGGDDPVAREKWGAVDFAFWHNKDAFGS